LRAGYAVVSADASGNAFGNPESRQQYRDLVRAAEQKYRAPATFFVAESMGALPALALLSEDDRHAIRGMIGITPLMGLPPRGKFINFVADAWDGSLPPEANPLAWPAATFANRTFELYVSPNDHVVPADASAQVFANRFGAVANVRVSPCTGGHVATDCFRGGDVVKWMDSLG
jgi:predicted alpha/beta hydrolase family esterase